MKNFSKTGFTLIELLFVIAIVGILMGFLSSAMMRSRQNAKAKKRQSDWGTLASAVWAYRAEYGHWPVDPANPGPQLVFSDDNYKIIEYMEGAESSQNPRKIKFVNWSEYTLNDKGAVVSPSSMNPYTFRINLSDDTVVISNVPPDPD